MLRSGGLRRRSDGFFSRVAYWIAYRVRIRAPRAAARLALQHPLRAVEVEVPATIVRAQRIPAIVHQTWSVNAFGRTHRASLARLQHANPDYAFRLSDDAQIAEYMAEHWAHHPIHEVFLRAEFGPLKTDVWRYCILYDQGGVYLDISKAVAVPLRELIDADDEAMLSFDKRSNFVPNPGEHLVHRVLVQDRAVSNWLIAVVPRHPLMLEVIDSIAANYAAYRGVTFARPKEAILDFSGPRRLTHALHAFLLKHPEARVRQHDPDFGGAAIWEVPGSWVRYSTRPAYILASKRSIVG